MRKKGLKVFVSNVKATFAWNIPRTCTQYGSNGCFLSLYWTLLYLPKFRVHNVHKTLAIHDDNVCLQLSYATASIRNFLQRVPAHTFKNRWRRCSKRFATIAAFDSFAMQHFHVVLLLSRHNYAYWTLTMQICDFRAKWATYPFHVSHYLSTMNQLSIKLKSRFNLFLKRAHTNFSPSIRSISRRLIMGLAVIPQLEGIRRRKQQVSVGFLLRGTLYSVLLN